jgi:hypothetical protein
MGMGVGLLKNQNIHYSINTNNYASSINWLMTKMTT